MSRPFYPIDAALSPRQILLFGLQHVLAMFVGIVTPPLVLAGAMNLSPETTATLISAALLASGLGTLLQVHGLGPFGCRMLSVQGTSFTYMPLVLAAGHTGGLALVYGMTLAGGVMQVLISGFLEPLRRWFPPVVTGTVVILLGCTLIGVGMTDFAGGHGNPHAGAPHYLAMGALVLASILLFSSVGGGRLASGSIGLGLALGYLVALALGQVDTAEVGKAAWFQVPSPLRWGLAFDPILLLPWAVAVLVSCLETMGDLTATSALSQQPLDGPIFARRLRSCLAADGLASVAAGLLSSTPLTTFAQNNGVIRLTGVAARRAGYGVAGSLIVLALIPKLGAVLSVMPKPVLGGATVLMFATVAVAGIDIVTQDGFAPREQRILAVALALGLGVTLAPQAAHGLADSASPILRSLGTLAESSLAVGALAAVFLNRVMPADGEDAESYHG